MQKRVEVLFAYLSPKPLYRVDAPPIIEPNPMRHESGDLLLNLIHYQVGHQASNQVCSPAFRLLRGRPK